ncbi:MAG: PIG-L family deacetylase [Bacteroidales bacterium]|jgi:LmbE family N-acetylglucosaminyl deacetylase|nr:PIG-L family deacetylase [Bacteroidales bacterium]
MNNILILSPHTDDAELGCGGTIIRFLKEGKNVIWIVFSTAEESLPPELPKDTLVTEFLNVTQYLGLKEDNYKIFHFEVRKLSDKRQEVLEELVRIRKTFKPDLVIGPSVNDYHQDHVVVANEMIRAFKSHCSIISYELPWNHVTFNTQMFITLEQQDIQKKYDLLRFYHSQMLVKRNYFTEEFILGLARVRGTQIGKEYAEAFEVIRWNI